MEKTEIGKAPKLRKNNRRSNESLAGWLFALPWLIGLAVFFIYPLLSSIYYSFTDYSIFAKWRFYRACKLP